jgi:hypothetical protein
MYDGMWKIKRIYKYIKNIKSILHHPTQNMARDDALFLVVYPKTSRTI